MDKLIKKINTSPLMRKRVTSGDAMQPYSRTFGISLKKLIEKEEFAKVPRIVTNICEFLLVNGLETEGIFRVNGNNKAVESIKLLFEENYSLDMSSCSDVYAVASVLKLFIRELPDGLVTERIAIQFVEVYKKYLNNIENCIEEFKHLLSLLPQENFNLLKYICQFLTKIAEKESANKMNGINLGIVFGPNIFRCSHDMEGLKLQSGMNNITSCFITNFDQLFKNNFGSHHRETINGSAYFGLDSPLVTQTMSSEGHKSSPSLSGDFDLSSSNDNQMCPAPLPTSISSNLHQAISNCINNHLSEDVDIPSTTLLDVPVPSNEYRMMRTSSMPHSISKYSSDVNEFTDISTKSSTEPTAQPRSNISFSSANTSKLKKPSQNHKQSTRKPLLVTQESWNDVIDQKDFTYLANKSGNAVMIDDMLPDWQGQNNLIDLDDFDGDVLINDAKENSMNYKADKINTFDSTKKCENSVFADRKPNLNEIKERIKYLRKMLKEFEESFERQHGCRPPNIEKTGNSQVQEWLTELVYLREKLNNWQSDSNQEGVSGDSVIVRSSHKLNGQDINIKSNAQLQSFASTYSGVSEQIGTANKLKVISTLENINTQNMTVVQYFDYLINAIENQRKRTNRPESFSEMTKEQLEEEKMDLQKCLLHFEKIYGRPRENNVKQTMKPLYDRYRLVKRLIKTTENEIKIPTMTINNQTNGEYGNSATTVSSRSRGHSMMKFSEEDIEAMGKPRKDQFTGTHETNNQMSHSFTTSNDGRSNYWKQTSSTGSLKSSGNNISQDNVKHATSQNSNTAQRLVSTESLPHKHGSNLKLKFHSSSVPMPVDNQNSFTPVIYNTPIHSVYSSKSFNSSLDDILPFRSCNTMSKIEIDAEKEMLLIEKRRLQKLLKDFEHGLEKMTGRKIEKSDRDNMRTEYDRYKTIKCRLRVLEKELER